jgi:nicotinate-nucleotide adenylyltransferase
MRLGILGGTFDPVHYGHLLLAECCREQLALDELWFLPAAVPPHKQSAALSPAAARVEMLHLATGGQAEFRVCTYEVDRGGVNYTVDTLAHCKALDPSRDLFFLMGADSLRDFPDWRAPARICQLATPAIVYRAGGNTDGQSESLDWGPLAQIVAADRLAEIRRHQVAMPRIDLCSSDLRRRVAAGQSIRYRTPRAVEKYIETAGLYRHTESAAMPPPR